MVDPQIASRLLTTIKWKRCSAIKPNLDKEFEPAVAVPCYQWYDAKQTFGPAGVVVSTTNSLYVADLNKHNVCEGDLIEWEGREYEVKRVQKYHHPMFVDQLMGVITI